VLQLRIRAVEGVVVPVEPAARFGNPEQQVDEHRSEQGVVLGGVAPGMGAGVDPRGRLARELLQRDHRVVAAT
jgi:hypothetical protein